MFHTHQPSSCRIIDIQSFRCVLQILQSYMFEPRVVSAKTGWKCDRQNISDIIQHLSNKISSYAQCVCGNIAVHLPTPLHGQWILDRCTLQLLYDIVIEQTSKRKLSKQSPTPSLPIPRVHSYSTLFGSFTLLHTSDIQINELGTIGDSTNLQSRINLVDHVGTRVSGPTLTKVRGRRGNGKILDIIWTLQDVGIQSTRDVPCDMTMEWPDSRIIAAPLKHLMAVNRSA